MTPAFWFRLTASIPLLKSLLITILKRCSQTQREEAGLDGFAIRVLRVLFMIKHVKEMPSTIDRLATLMVDNINADKAALKNKIFEALQQLEEETLIQKNGEEYDFPY